MSTRDKIKEIIRQLIKRVGINIDKLVFTPLGNMMSTLTDFEKDNGAI